MTNDPPLRVVNDGPLPRYRGHTWVGWLNLLLLQWLFVRLAYRVDERDVHGVHYAVGDGPIRTSDDEHEWHVVALLERGVRLAAVTGWGFCFALPFWGRTLTKAWIWPRARAEAGAGQ